MVEVAGMKLQVTVRRSAREEKSGHRCSGQSYGCGYETGCRQVRWHALA